MTNNHWTNIHHSFNEELKNQWENNGFTYQQTRDWINIGLLPTEVDFAGWLAQEGYTALSVLNYADKQALQKAYQKSLTNPQPPFSFPPSPKPWWKLLLAFILTLIATYLLTN